MGWPHEAIDKAHRRCAVLVVAVVVDRRVIRGHFETVWFLAY